MRALASYYYGIVQEAYSDWKRSVAGDGVPGRLVFKEFDVAVISELLLLIKEQECLPLADVGSEDGFIVAVEAHEQYEAVDTQKYSFADLAHERNRAGNFFCLMFIAEIKPTLEQVAGIDQSAVFEQSEIIKWVTLANNAGENTALFTDVYVKSLARFIYELTNAKWSNRAFIEIDKINNFIEGVINSTIIKGMFYEALGENCTKLGGINRLNVFKSLDGAGSKYRRVFRSLVSKTLFVDIDFWKASYRNKEIDFSDIELNIAEIKDQLTDYNEFCELVEKYFQAYHTTDRTCVNNIKAELQANFDCSNPYASVLQRKVTKPKILLGELTQQYFSDNDIELSAENIELLTNLDIKQADVNELRNFYFAHSKIIAENTKLDNGWLKVISTSKVTVCSDFAEGLLTVLSESILINDIGQDKVTLSLHKDRRKSSLEKKNWFALNFFIKEYYRDLPAFWCQFGTGFSLDFGQAFSDDLADSISKRTEREGKAANEFTFKITRTNSNGDATESWDLKWIFNPYSFAAVKYIDFEKVLGRDGYFFNHEVSIDPLFIKRALNSPSIDNVHMFLAISAGSIKKGAVVKKTAKESVKFESILSDLVSHKYINVNEFENVKRCFSNFTASWRESIDIALLRPMCGENTSLEESLIDLLSTLQELIPRSVKVRELIYLILASHTFSVKDYPEFVVQLPWAPYSLLQRAYKAKLLNKIACSYNERKLLVGNKNEGVLAKLFSELWQHLGKGVLMKQIDSSQWEDLICTKSIAGYYEYSNLRNSQSAIQESEIKAVLRSTVTKFLDTYPNERHHLQLICSGLNSYEHLFAAYEELLQIVDNHEEQITVLLGITCDDRAALDGIFQVICESFEHSKIDANIKIKLHANIAEVEDGEIDILFNFDPIFSHNSLSNQSASYIVQNNLSINWEYCASRKVPMDPLSKQSQFSLNNHVLTPVEAKIHESYLRVANRDDNASLSREVNQLELKDEIDSGLSKCNWLVIYDYLLCRQTLDICNDSADESIDTERRILRFIQGEGVKRSLAIITDKETLHITKNLNKKIKEWNLVHPSKATTLVNKVFSLANSYGSDALLRSVGNGNFSHDLLGTAGAVALLEGNLDTANRLAPIIWVHLDDYLNWFSSSIEDDSIRALGKKINYISDLLGIYLTKDSKNNITVHLVVSEAKLTNGKQEHDVKSSKQLKSTTDLIQAMLETSTNIDYSYWINKFYEFIISNFKFIPNEFEFRDLLELDKNTLNITLHGVSVMFTHENNSTETSCKNLYEQTHLTQIELSIADTSTVFGSMLSSSKDKSIPSFKFLPIFLNSSCDADIVVNCADDVAESTNDFEANNLQISDSINEIETVKSQRLLPSASCSDVKSTAFEDNVAKALFDKALEFLQKHNYGSSAQPVEIESVKVNIREIFSHYNLPSRFAATEVTPNSIVIKLHGDVNLTPNKVLNLKSSFMSVVGLALRDVYPDYGVMVLVFDRKERETVHLFDLLKSSLEKRQISIDSGFNYSILLGQDEYSGDCIYYRLDGPSPHALVGGQTKSGKSVLMNNMIIDLLLTNKPENLSLRLFDPKQVEFAAYERMPHLAHPVVLNKADAAMRLEELQFLMNTRFEMFKDQGIKDFEAYNRKWPNAKLSREVVFFDELADWLLDSDFKAAAKDTIVKLSSKGRAAGVHLILATQRPSADVVFPMLRANLDTKIALKVDREQNSEIILGEPGAENLLGYGHGIVKTEGEKKVIQVGFTDQVVFDELIDLITSYWVDLHPIN